MSLKKYHVFIGHSDQRFLAELTPLLERWFTVSASHVGADIVNVILEEQPDLAILDFTIPEIDVIGLCQQLSVDYAGLDMVIYVDRSEAPLARKKWRKRAMDYIVGPLDPESMCEEVCKVVRYLVAHNEREMLARRFVELRYLLTTRFAALRTVAGTLPSGLAQAHDLTRELDEFEQVIRDSELL